MAQVTELLAVPRPVVIGFLRRTARGGVRRATALNGVLSSFCERHELVLDDVVTETPQAPDEFDRLLAAISAGDDPVYGLVVPTAAHLGAAPVARRRSSQIASAQLRLLVVRPQPNHDRSLR
jgi:hypothetical protein